MNTAASHLEVLTLDECAAFLRCHRSTIYRLLKADNRFPHFKVGSDYRFVRAELEAWMRSQGNGNVSKG